MCQHCAVRWAITCRLLTSEFPRPIDQVLLLGSKGFPQPESKLGNKLMTALRFSAQNSPPRS